MDQLTAFYELKQLVLLRYREEYPYVSPEWKTFSSKDILQLIESIETETKQRISEKWIYTHLKPEVNEKLPRKDMLDILTSYCHMDSWNAFVYSLNKPVLSDGVSEDGTIPEPIQPKSTNRWLFVLIGMFAVTIGVFLWKYRGVQTKTVQSEIPVKDFYTGEEIHDTTIQLFVKENEGLKPLRIKNSSSFNLEEKTEIVVESPFYSEAKVEIERETKSIVLKPDDYAMMLKAFIQSDIKDWETRKTQLNSILSENLEVLIHLQNNLGIEYMNKEEFTQKLTIPTTGVKRWQVLSLEQDSSQRITKIRIKQN